MEKYGSRESSLELELQLEIVIRMIVIFCELRIFSIEPLTFILDVITKCIHN